MPLKGFAALLLVLGLISSMGGTSLAQTVGCVPEEDRAFLGLLDRTKGDDLLTIADLQTIAATFPDSIPRQAELLELIADALATGITGLRYDLTGPCPTDVPPTQVPTQVPTQFPTQVPMQELTLSGQAHGFLEVPGAEFACHWFTIPATEGAAGPDDVASRSWHAPRVTARLRRAA